MINNNIKIIYHFCVFLYLGYISTLINDNINKFILIFIALIHLYDCIWFINDKR
jgi:hypothetical protein